MVNTESCWLVVQQSSRGSFFCFVLSCWRAQELAEVVGLDGMCDDDDDDDDDEDDDVDDHDHDDQDRDDNQNKL